MWEKRGVRAHTIFPYLQSEIETHRDSQEFQCSCICVIMRICINVRVSTRKVRNQVSRCTLSWKRWPTWIPYLYFQIAFVTIGFPSAKYVSAQQYDRLHTHCLFKEAWSSVTKYPYVNDVARWRVLLHGRPWFYIQGVWKFLNHRLWFLLV